MFRSKKKEEVKSSSTHIRAPLAFAAKGKGKDSKKTTKISQAPFILERQFGQSIGKRSELMAHHASTLGPPDLIHLSSRSGSKDVGQFHYLTGLDVSSVAAPVAYLTKLVYNTQFDENSLVSSIGSGTIGTYCSWNCFSKCDIRINSEFPGPRTSVQLVGINGKPFHIRLNNPSVSRIPRSSEQSPNQSQVLQQNLQQQQQTQKNKQDQDIYGSAISFSVPETPKFVDGIPEEIWRQTYVSGIMRNILFSDNLEYNKPSLIQNTLISTKSAAKKIIDMIVQMLPKGFLTGCSELYQGPDFIHNYLVDTLLKILKISDLYEYAIKLVEECISYNFDYHLILVELIIASKTNEIRLVRELKNGLDFYSTNRPGTKNYIDYYLLEQSKLMTQKHNFNSALYLATKAIETNPTEFINWTNLLETYITKNDVQNALLTLNSCPVYSLPTAKTIHRIKEENSLIDYNNINYKFPEPSQEGYLSEIWNQANRTGPVYLKDKDAILSEDFVSDMELKTVDPILLRLTGPKLKGTFKAAYNYLSSLAILVGWDNLLKVRAEVFVMEGEYRASEIRSSSVESLSSKQNTLKSNLLYAGKSVTFPSVSVEKKDGQVIFKSKRLCERWLDSLFFMLYDDLKVVSLWEVEAKKTGNAIRHSTLEWELIGITAYRAKHYDLAISALRTSLTAKFSIISAQNLLNIFQEFFQNYDYFKRLNINFDNNRYAKDLLFVGLNNILYPIKKEFVIDKSQIEALLVSEQLKLINQQSLESNLYLDLILEVLIKVFSWNYRWYEDFCIDCLIFLKEILKENEKDLIINKLRAAYDSEGNAVRLLERYISWIEMFDDQK